MVCLHLATEQLLARLLSSKALGDNYSKGISTFTSVINSLRSWGRNLVILTVICFQHRRPRLQVCQLRR